MALCPTIGSPMFVAENVDTLWSWLLHWAETPLWTSDAKVPNFDASKEQEIS